MICAPNEEPEEITAGHTMRIKARAIFGAWYPSLHPCEVIRYSKKSKSAPVSAKRYVATPKRIPLLWRRSRASPNVEVIVWTSYRFGPVSKATCRPRNWRGTTVLQKRSAIAAAKISGTIATAEKPPIIDGADMILLTHFAFN